ncbi:MAG: hypothetical protein PGN12_07585 [Sphingomonas phyllosphaerae]
MLIRSLFLLGVVLATSPAMAAGPLQVTSQVMVEAKQRAADGTTKIALVPAHRVVPGDRVVFTLAYRNTGAQPLADLVFDNPVPKGVAYRAPVPNSPAPELSVDGHRYGTLAQLGAVEPDAVTHVRWRLARPLAPGASGTFAFQAVLK